MKISLPEVTDLDGALRRGEGGWYWADGRFEPRVRDLLLEELAPDWRCVRRGRRAWIEVPTEWRTQIRHPELTRAVTELVRHYGQIGSIRDGGAAKAVGERGHARSGYRVPLEAWRVIMCQPCGATWDPANDAEIRAIAREQLRHQE